MNNNIMALINKSDGNVELFAELLIKECANICETLKFTEAGPSTEARFQRVLCSRAIQEHFGLVGQAPIQPIND